MSVDVLELFESLPGETTPRYLPTGDTAYKYVWTEARTQDDWKADGYRWRNQGAGKKIKKINADVTKTFFHVRIPVLVLC